MPTLETRENDPCAGHSSSLTIFTKTAIYNVQKLTVTLIFYRFFGYIHNIIALSAIKSYDFPFLDGITFS